MKKGLLVGLLAGILIVPFVLVEVAHADVNDFTVTNFSADETLSLSDPQGSLHIIESISVNFTDNNHGLIRSIPNDYNGQPLNFRLNNISSKTGAPTQVSQSSENNNILLKIGDPNRTVTGEQQYTIDYTVENVISFYDDHDELYWDVNGDQWKQPVTSVDVTLHLPSGVTQWARQPVCYSGSYGETNSYCAVTTSGSEVKASAQNLLASQTLTYVVGFNKGAFHPETTAEIAQHNAGWILGLGAMPLLSAVTGFTWWWRRGRDPKGRSVIVPEYEPPKGISPIEAGTIARFAFSDADLTATIIDLARRGYLRIHETKKDRLILKDKLSYSLELVDANTSKLNHYEAGLIKHLFTSLSVGKTVDLSKPNTAMQTYLPQIRESVSKNLKQAGYFQQHPFRLSKNVLLGWTVFLLATAAVAVALHQFVAVVIGAIISIIVISFFMALLPARTAQGVAAKEQLEGLALYMETAEKDRLEKLEGPDAAYAPNKTEPKRTVELFEKLLPYAIVMGVESQWAQQFASFYKTPPDWYAGNTSNFNSIYLANSLNTNFSSAMSSSFAPPSSSSSSGFSSGGGGGFSGGGGGGGGGGGW